MEFPVIDMYNSLMYDYDHYWSNGFGTTLPDRYKNTLILLNSTTIIFLESSILKNLLRNDGCIKLKDIPAVSQFSSKIHNWELTMMKGSFSLL